MKDDRLRSPVEKNYIEAIGLAAYTFASLEWQVVWCMEKISPKSIHKVVNEEMTAGKIAKKFMNAIHSMPKSDEREQLKEHANRFRELVQVRNDIIHGKPCTSPEQEQRLSGDKIIEVVDLENAADDFVECTNKLNTLFYDYLSTYTPL